MYVGSAQVESPGNVVELRHEHTACACAAHLGAYAAELFSHRLAGVFERMNLHLVQRHRRTVCPHAVEDVEIGAQRESAGMSQFRLQPLSLALRDAHAVDAHLRRVGILQFACQPVGNRRCALHALAHQLKLGTFELLLGSDEVARVGPERSRTERDHRRASRTVEARYPLASLPTLGNILTHVWVGTRENERREPLALHLLAQCGESCGYSILRICHIKIIRYCKYTDFKNKQHYNFRETFVYFKKVVSLQLVNEIQLLI